MLRILFVGFAISALALGATAQTPPSNPASPQLQGETVVGGPVRLRQPVMPTTTPPTGVPGIPASGVAQEQRVQPAPPLTVLSDFERFARVRRFGSDLMVDSEATDATSPLVPGDYLLSPGDEIIVTLWGSIDADLRLIIDRSGRVMIPRVGPVMLAGVRYADAPEVIRRRVAEVFRHFDVSLTLGQLRGIRVYVTGFVARPGMYTVSSLSTVMQALLRAGGPSPAGSFRRIELRRPGQETIRYDLYDLLLNGDRGTDRPLLAGDVIHVAAVGSQVALLGSVNKPAIFELKAGETVADVLRMAGGFTSVADRSRLAVERLNERNTVRIAEIQLPEAARSPLNDGDVLRAFSAVEAALPVGRQSKRIRVEGEVQRPGEYVLPAESTISQALRVAGGLNPTAFVFGTEFTRESVRIRQQENYERALRDLETEFTKASTTQRATTADEAAVLNVRSSNTSKLIEQLRAVKPTGRIVLQLSPDSRELPDLALEDGDRLYIPPRPTTVGVFGSVFNGGSYLFREDTGLTSYLKLAGGPTRGADAASTFVIRANGAVVSARQSSGWFGMSGLAGLDSTIAVPGDTIFVPEEFNKSTFIQNAKDWTQILYQFALGIAAINTLK